MYLIDTSIVSYGIRSDPILELYETEMNSPSPKFISVQTVAELLIWAGKRKWSESRRAWLQNDLEKFEILPIDFETAEICAAIRVASDSIGRCLSVSDSWIMATAKQYELTLVTHDRDMMVGEQLGLRVICRALGK